ncbi:MAG: uracil-DNA glycosylase [Rhodocyclaceae bacterium]|jgi:DNA polymerase|nr:uracil-DNA glycosylase [Rhodocyclaceae bacterium]MBK6553506.1 uracil-DNA glycosylase [Rhodocyclaceae bacterium]MBK6675481.1 uracil-DNA glycosylase [Rhodocyclaceae bacterium]MBK9311216.1 uracil-DNA glycosylase [Rhodocyclaceae bacterium]MBK9956561.1 uracil-DNA glycosylase [Rhodocyclaceae bacterium]
MRREALLRELGLGPVWRLRQPAAEATVPRVPERSTDAGVSPPLTFDQPAPTDDGDDRAAAIARMGWDELKTAVADCRACGLCQARQQAVLGVGDIEADWLFVGEGPGAEEDERGEPFVGQAGKLLDAMLAAIDLKRGENVYIANAVKCRPPNNRTPEPDETAACRPYLERQIALIRPKLIVALGRPAAQTLLQSEVKIASARGRVFDFNGTPLIVTYHPAYLLRNLPDKAKAWEDLCFMRGTMKGS